MSRYSIAGFRGGELIQTPAGDVRLHPNDGAAELSAAQQAYFKSAGLAMTKAADEAPDAPAVQATPVDEEIALALKRGEQQAAEATSAAAARAAAEKPAPAKV